MVRRGEAKDAKKLVEYLREVHEVTERPAKFNDKSALKSMQVALNCPKEHAVWLVEKEKEIRGVLVGISNPIWYSTSKEVLDLVFYISEDARGEGAWIVRKYLKWAATVPGAKEIFLSETYGHNDRTHRMYTRMGLEHVGHIYRTTV